MGSRSVSQFPLRSDYDSSDRVPVVVDLGGGAYANRYVTRDLLGIPVRRASVVLSSSEVLNLNTARIEVVAGQAGKYLVPLFATMTRISGTTNYDTNTDIVIGPASVMNDNDWLIGGTIPGAAGVAVGLLTGSSAPALPTKSSLVQGEALSAYVRTGNPATGDGSYAITLYYLVI